MPRSFWLRDHQFSSRLSRASHPDCRATAEILADGRPLDLPSATLSARVWPTTPQLGRWQTLMGIWSDAAGSGYLLGTDPAGCLAVRVGNGGAGTVELSTGRPLLERHWYLAAASFDAATGAVWVAQYALHRYHSRADTAAEVRVVSSLGLAAGPAAGPGFRIAAAYGDPITTPDAACWGGHQPALLYNGKIDGPAVLARSATPLEQQEATAAGRRPGGDAGDDPDLVAAWDFSQEIPTTRIVDRSPHGLHGEAINLPTRAMKG